MTKEEIQEYLISWFNITATTKSILSDKECKEILIECSDISLIEIDRNKHRWWDSLIMVGKYGEKYFSFEYATANRDESIEDLGWEFDWSFVKEVTPVKEMIEVTKYINI